jgi:hypothetical protein
MPFCAVDGTLAAHGPTGGEGRVPAPPELKTRTLDKLETRSLESIA